MLPSEAQNGQKAPFEHVAVRRIKTSDFARLTEILTKAFEKEIAVVGLDSNRLMSFRKYHVFIEMLYRIFDFLNKDYPTILVATLNNYVVGEVHITPLRRGIWAIDSLATDPTYVQKGVGYHLIKGSVEYIAKKQGKKALSSIRTDNIPALKIAEKLGFIPYRKTIVLYRQIATTPETINLHNVIMRKFQATDAGKAFRIIADTDPTKTEQSQMTPESLKTTLLENLINIVLRTHSEKFIAETQNKIAGYAYVTYTSPREAARIEALYTTEYADSKVLIESMSTHVLRLLREKNITKVTIAIDVKRQDTQEVLLKLGFTPIASFHEISKQLTDKI